MDREAARTSMAWCKHGGGVWESNPPTGGLTRSTGFEVQGPHQQPNASSVILQVFLYHHHFGTAHPSQKTSHSARDFADSGHRRTAVLPSAEMGIAQGHLDGFVAQHRPYRGYIQSVLHQACPYRMAQVVKTHSGQARSIGRRRKDLLMER